MIGIGKKEPFHFGKLPAMKGKRDPSIKVISLEVFYAVTQCGTLCTYCAFVRVYLN